MRADEILIQAFNFLKSGELSAASNVISTLYPRIHPANRPLVMETQKLGFSTSPIITKAKSNNQFERRSFSETEKDSIFLNDYYQCRYSGLKLFSPPALTLISLYLNEVFPSYKIPHFPLNKNHQGIYTLYPSPDHVDSLYAGGTNEIANLVTSSSALNMVKSRYSNVEMGWQLLDRSKLDVDWDGGRTWYLQVVSDHKEFRKLVAKSLMLETFHRKIDPAAYFNKWTNAFNKNNQSKHQFRKHVERLIPKEFVSANTLNVLKDKTPIFPSISKIKHSKIVSILSANVNLREETAQVPPNPIDIKSLPIGSICRNKKSNNRYVSLKKEPQELTVFSNDENFPMKIKTKPLLVSVEFIPSLNVSSIVELPVQIYTEEQLDFIKRACIRWSNGHINGLSSVELTDDTIYQYLLKRQ